MPLIAQAVEEALEGGAVYGHPAVDIAVALTDATVREGQASEMAFRVAAMTAVKQGLHAAQPQLLQPIMKVEIIAPEEFTGEVMGDFAARKGKVEHLLAKGPVRLIGARPAVRDVRLCHRPALPDPGPGHLHPAVRPPRLRGALARRDRDFPFRHSPRVCCIIS